MYTTTENGLRLDEIFDNAVYVSDLTDEEKREVLDAIMEQGYQLKYTDPIVKAGDRVWGKDATNTLFGGDNFIATVVTAPPTLAAHFTDVFRY